VNENKNGMNGWLRRARALLEIAQQPGNLAIVLMSFMLGIFTGWIPSPLLTIKTSLEHHDSRVDRLIEQRLRLDSKLVEVLEGLSREVRDQNRRDRVKECSQYKDVDLRKKCLEP